MEQGDAFPAPGILPALDALGLEFLTEIFEVEVGRHPENLAALGELGHLYTKLGKHAQGLAVDRRLVEMRPSDPTTHYNLACSLALVGEAGACIAALERAIALGYDDLAHLLADEDLASVRDHAGFRRIAKGLEAKPETPEGSPETPAGP